MLFAGVMRTSERRHGSVGEIYANHRHIIPLKLQNTTEVALPDAENAQILIVVFRGRGRVHKVLSIV